MLYPGSGLLWATHGNIEWSYYLGGKISQAGGITAAQPLWTDHLRDLFRCLAERFDLGSHHRISSVFRAADPACGLELANYFSALVRCKQLFGMALVDISFRGVIT